MEKKSRTGDSVFLKLPRMFLIMKTVFISLVCTLNVQANVFSQHTKFDIAMKNVTVSEVLCYLEEISKYRFVYDSDAIDRMQRVDVEMKGTKLETVLESIFVKSGFSFVIEDGVVIIREAGKKQITAGILPQSRKITGRVRDHGGHPLPGVTVVLKGTSVGVVTDVDGHFKMDLPADHETVLVFSFVGMKTQEVYYKGEKELNVVMEEEVKQMDEVVVTGIFSKSKESYTGAVSVTFGPVSILLDAMTGLGMLSLLLFFQLQLQLLYAQPLLFQGQIRQGRVKGQQRIALFHRVALLDEDLRHRLGGGEVHGLDPVRGHGAVAFLAVAPIIRHADIHKVIDADRVRIPVAVIIPQAAPDGHHQHGRHHRDHDFSGLGFGLCGLRRRRRRR